MSIAVQSTLELTHRIFIWLDNRINDHFEQIRTATINSALTSYNLAVSCAQEFNLKHQECIGLVSLLLKNKEGLKVKSDSAGTIVSAFDEPKPVALTSKESALRSALRFYDKVVKIAPSFLEDGFVEARSKSTNSEFGSSVKTIVKIEDICDKISAALNIRYYAAYYCFKQYIENERPELFVKRGSNGGVAFKKRLQS